MILVNFKNYKGGVGDAAVKLAITCEKVTRETEVPIIPVVSVVDLFVIKPRVGIPIWVQHVDGVEYGAHTGWVLPEAIVAAGGGGTLLNHSEHRLLNDEIRRSFTRAKDVGLSVCMCAADLEEATRLSQMNPDYIAYEPPELIGSHDKSVASEKSDVIREAVGALSVPLLIGAGIRDYNDVVVSLKLGAVGVLVSSGVVEAFDPEKELRELARAFEEKEKKSAVIV